MSRARRDEHGAIAILVALSSVVLFVLCGLVVDLGMARDLRRQAQNAADSGALAAAGVLFPASGQCRDGGPTPCFADAVDLARTTALANLGLDPAEVDWSACPAPPAGFTAYDASVRCIAFDGLSATAPPRNVAMAVPPLTMETGFGALAGVDEVTLTGFAQAELTERDATADCGLCVLDEASLTGNASLRVSGAGIGMNGGPAFTGNLTVSVTDGGFTTEEAPRKTGNVQLDPEPTRGIRVADPLASLPMPFDTGALPVVGPVSVAGNGHCTLEPGRYDSISITGNHDCTLRPGLYAITGSMSLTGNVTVDASAGVTLYFTCGTAATPHECGEGGTDPEDGGALRYTGNQRLRLVAPADGPTQGLAIVYDRNNGSELHYTGNQGNVLYGSVYAAGSRLNITGNAGTAALDTMIVVGDLHLTGNAEITDHYTPERNVRLAERTTALVR